MRWCRDDDDLEEESEHSCSTNQRWVFIVITNEKPVLPVLAAVLHSMSSCTVSLTENWSDFVQFVKFFNKSLIFWISWEKLMNTLNSITHSEVLLQKTVDQFVLILASNQSRSLTNQRSVLMCVNQSEASITWLRISLRYEKMLSWPVVWMCLMLASNMTNTPDLPPPSWQWTTGQPIRDQYWFVSTNQKWVLPGGPCRHDLDCSRLTSRRNWRRAPVQQIRD